MILNNTIQHGTGKVKLSDFVMATQLEQGKMLEEVCGSLLYMVTEKLATKPYDGLADDKWSLGIILYIMVTGHFTYVETTLDGMHKIITTTECPIPTICKIPITLWLYMEWHWLGHIHQRTSHSSKEIIPRVIQPMSSMD